MEVQELVVHQVQRGLQEQVVQLEHQVQVEVQGLQEALVRRVV